MYIKVLARKGVPAKEQGDAFESFIARWMKKLGYSIIRNVRTTACELDILCKNNISGKSIYVECKAYNETKISANLLTSFLGKVHFKEYAEGWFVSTGEFGRDALGFLEDWEAKGDRSRLSLYTPDRLLDSLIKTEMVSKPPEEMLKSKLVETENIGDWVLLISDFGVYWGVPILRDGFKSSWALFSTDAAPRIISDQRTINEIVASGFELSRLPLWNRYSVNNPKVYNCRQGVVEVEVGDSWEDYRPSKPEYFVGRRMDLRRLSEWLGRIKNGSITSRVFAVIGDSGIGKSSFIAKVRDYFNKSKNENVFVYAVDARAANDSSYIEQSLLSALRHAQALGFGCDIDLMLSNGIHPLDSESLHVFFEACKAKNQVIVLVIDQFEELYSKPDLMDVFEAARELMLSTISAASNFVVGFAWKSDATIPQEHPAYYIWHNLADHRFELALHLFSVADVSLYLNKFEKELGQKLKPDLRKYLMDGCQGYPWLLKKLCVHVYKRIREGATQTKMEDTALDIHALFDSDLSMLSEAELKCLKYIASNSPTDIFDVLEIAANETIKSLQEKRLILKKGTKLYLYWDIFKDYVIDGTIPFIPFAYIPHASSLKQIVSAALALDQGHSMSIDELSRKIGLRVGTVSNRLTDLVRLGIAHNIDGRYVLDGGLSRDSLSILRFIRNVFKRHAFLMQLKKRSLNKPCTLRELKDAVKNLTPARGYSEKTLLVYARTIRNMLVQLGYASMDGECIVYKDSGDVFEDLQLVNPGKGRVFIGDTSPYQAYLALKTIASECSLRSNQAAELEMSNAVAVLVRMRLVKLSKRGYVLSSNDWSESDLLPEMFDRAVKEPSVKKTIEILEAVPHISPAKLGREINVFFNRDWKQATEKRIGGALRIWARWIMNSSLQHEILPPPGRHKHAESEDQLLFGFM